MNDVFTEIREQRLAHFRDTGHKPRRWYPGNPHLIEKLVAEANDFFERWTIEAESKIPAHDGDWCFVVIARDDKPAAVEFDLSEYFTVRLELVAGAVLRLTPPFRQISVDEVAGIFWRYFEPPSPRDAGQLVPGPSTGGPASR